MKKGSGAPPEEENPDADGGEVGVTAVERKRTKRGMVVVAEGSEHDDTGSDDDGDESSEEPSAEETEQPSETVEPTEVDMTAQDGDDNSDEVN